MKKVISTYPQAKKFENKIIEFILKSDCKNIENTNFKYPAAGAALADKVLINNNAFNQPFEMFLFILFHEIAHQYQYKKYGAEKMYEFYNDEISVDDCAKYMKYVEVIADEFATRKVREFFKLGAFKRLPNFNGFYKNIELSYFKNFISKIREHMIDKDISSPEKISEIMYNYIKAEI